MLVNAWSDSICYEFRNTKDSLIDRYCMYKTTGISSVTTGAGLQIYPNPSTGMFRVKTGKFPFSKGKTHMIITDATGKEVFHAQLQAPDTTIDLAALPKGIYLFRLVLEKEIVDRVKLVIE